MRIKSIPVTIALIHVKSKLILYLTLSSCSVTKMSASAVTTTDSTDLDDVADGMLEYETQLFLDIVQSDGIVVAAKGVCLLNVVANILRVYADAGNLVFVVNCSEHEERRLKSRLLASHVAETLLYTTTYSSGGTEDRCNLYLSGGIHFITTRILVLDLLKNRIPIAKITGVVVLNAHRVLESGQEAFVLRLYRQINRTGFVKAFSNDAQSFTYGFGQLERIMRNLFVREVHIWPRFHSSVIASLKARPPPNLIELHIPLTPAMERIQTCLLELINTLIKEIKSANKTIELAELSVENSLLPKFMRLLQTQLDAIWERLSTSSRRLASELRTLHQLLVRHLFHTDAVGFYTHMQQYRSKEYGANSTWVYYREAEHLFTATKGRVLSNTNEFDPEYSPKWKPLFDILNSEIPNDSKIAEAAGNRQTTVVLILCQDRRTCHQLNQFLLYGPRHYLLMQALQNCVKFDTLSDAFKKCKAILPVAKQNEKGKQNVNDVLDDRIQEPDEHEEKELKNVYHLTMNESSAKDGASPSADESVHDDSQYVFEPVEGPEEIVSTGATSVVIRTFREAVCGGEGSTATLPEALEMLKPAYVVLYQANVTAIRQLEIYEARKIGKDVPTKIFFLVHAGTVEEQSYLTSLRREKQAFEHLIETKTKMVVPEDQDGRCSPIIDPTDGASSRSSRTGGAGVAIHKAPTVVVDMREFRSELPALLHKRGVQICPLTITVGDYILTPSICVERKSLADLVGSLQSGRLYAQCNQMQRAYARPMLLIEFDQNKQFSWESIHYMISTDAEQSDGSSFDVQRKLVLLTMHFPKLRIIWSPNPYATAALFQELKEGKEEPNPEHIQTCQEDQQRSGNMVDKYNATLSDVLNKLGGVTSRTVTHLMAAYSNLTDLCGATELKLRAVLSASDAKALYATLHGDTAAADLRGAATGAGGKNKGRGAKSNKFKYNNKKAAM